MDLGEIGRRSELTASSEVEHANAPRERQASISSSRREQAILSEEACRACWPNVPSTAAAFLKEECPEHFHLAMDDAALIDPADLADPALAELLLLDCVNAAKIASLNHDEEQLAVFNEEQGRELSTDAAVIAAQKAAGAKLDATITGLRQRISGNLSGPDKLGQLDQLIAQVKDAESFSQAERGAAFRQLEMIRSTLMTMQEVVADPDEKAAFDAILANSSLKLGATSCLSIFAEVMTDVDASAELSEDTKSKLRSTLGVPNVNTGSQAQRILRETRLDESCREVPVWPEDSALEVRDGVSMFSDINRRQYMRAEFNGHITTIDTTGWSGEAVGKYLEALSFVHDVESFGGTGLFHSIYHIDFNLTGNEGFDPQKIDQILGIMGKWFGGFESADGDVRRNGERRGFIRYVVRLLSKRGTASGFEESQADTNEVLDELGLRYPDGSPNWTQIDRLGEFARRTYLSGDADYEDLSRYLTSTSAIAN